MPAPVVTTQPSPVTAAAGTNATFTASATGATFATLYRSSGGGGVSYGGNAPNTSGSVSITISAVTSADQGSYFFAFRDGSGATTLTSSAALTVTGGSGGSGGGTGGGSTSGSSGSNAVSTGPLVTYVGDASVLGGVFLDQYEPTPGKSEWGMDMLTRLMRGIAPYALTYALSLTQGQTFHCNGTPYYLQSFEPDNNPVFPGFTLHYKGLIGGIPPPKADGQSIEQSITLSAGTVSGYQSATRDIRYVTRQGKTRYITSSRPTGPTYGVDTSVAPVILSSVIRATDTAGNNYVFNGANAPAALVTALTPAYGVQAFMECTPVVGSPYFECTDSATNLCQGS